jgi:tryptophan 2,3-dioxygenase
MSEKNKVEIIEEDIKENPTFEEYMKNPEKYWNNLLEKLDEIEQYLKND